MILLLSSRASSWALALLCNVYGISAALVSLSCSAIAHLTLVPLRWLFGSAVSIAQPAVSYLARNFVVPLLIFSSLASIFGACAGVVVAYCVVFIRWMASEPDDSVIMPMLTPSRKHSVDYPLAASLGEIRELAHSPKTFRGSSRASAAGTAVGSARNSARTSARTSPRGSPSSPASPRDSPSSPRDSLDPSPKVSRPPSPKMATLLSGTRNQQLPEDTKLSTHLLNMRLLKSESSPSLAHQSYRPLVPLEKSSRSLDIPKKHNPAVKQKRVSINETPLAASTPPHTPASLSPSQELTPGSQISQSTSAVDLRYKSDLSVISEEGVIVNTFHTKKRLTQSAPISPLVERVLMSCMYDDEDGYFQLAEQEMSSILSINPARGTTFEESPRNMAV